MILHVSSLVRLVVSLGLVGLLGACGNTDS